jgi:hypothetical protein
MLLSGAVYKKAAATQRISDRSQLNKCQILASLFQRFIVKVDVSKFVK